MEDLTSRKAYTAAMAAQIEAMGAMAVSVANRWQMGWPTRVTALLKSGAYLGRPETQVNQEKNTLANEANLRRLTRREILQMYEIQESPPC